MFLSSNGNVAPELFKCVAPLKAGGKLAGAVALGRRPATRRMKKRTRRDGILSSYIALAVQNHALGQSIVQRVSENLRLLALLHGFYDNALEAFATAIDVKHVNIHGHSLRVGRYAPAIGEAMGIEPSQVAALRWAGYLHDIGKVAVDRRLLTRLPHLILKNFATWATTPSLGIRLSAACNFPGRRFPKSFAGTTNAATVQDIPTGWWDEMPMPVRISGWRTLSTR